MSNYISLYLSIILILALAGCNQDDAKPQGFWSLHQPFSTDYVVPSGLEVTDKFTEKGNSLGVSTMGESSGIVYSKVNPGYIWSHNDKNNENLLYLLDAQTGSTVARYILNGMLNRDWEDIELGPGPEEGVNYIYLGEIGDNNRQYRDYKIYRFAEPVFDESHRGQRVSWDTEFDAITFTYADGEKHDSETLLLDPLTKDLFIVTKRSFYSKIYVLPFPQQTDGATTALVVGEFPFTRATGGNISSDGREMLIKTYDHIMYWYRTSEESMVEMFQKTPLLAPYNPVEPQGEAICFDPDGGYYTLSEFSNAIVPELYHYERLKR